MHPKILNEMRSRVRAGRLAMTPHGLDELYADGLTMDDLRHCILNGQIVERQFDDFFAEYKYVIEGETETYDEIIHVVAKLGKRNTVVITTYRVT